MTSRDKPTWELYCAETGNEELTAAVAVLGCDPFKKVMRDAGRWLYFSKSGGGRMVDGVFCPDPLLDWQAWVDDVDKVGRGWSSNEWRLYDVAAGLATGRPFNIVGTLDRLDEWWSPVMKILNTWSAGGNAAQIRASAP